MYSYGHYDPSSCRLFSTITIGEGVLFITNKEGYLPFALEDQRKSFFGFGLNLNTQQKTAVKAQIELLKSDAIAWYRPVISEHESRIYVSLLANRVSGTSFYKLTKGKLKPIFLGENPV